MWFHMARYLLQQDLNARVEAIRVTWSGRRQLAYQNLAGDLLAQAIAASHANEAEEIAQVHREFEANWHNLNLSTFTMRHTYS